MATAKDKKNEKARKVLSARKRAEQRESGGRSCYSIPEGISLFTPKKEGAYKFDIVPFTAGKGNPGADEGELHYERTFHVHFGVGANNEAYCCPAKCWGKPCPICEHRARLDKQGADDAEVAALKPKERQLFLLYVPEGDEKVLKLWDVSFHLFGRHLNKKILNSDEDDGYEYFADPERGMTLRVGANEESGNGRTWLSFADIEFKARPKPLPDDVVSSAPCLDDLLKEVSYDDMRKVFLQTTEDEPAPKTAKNGKAAKPNTKAARDEEEDEEDEAPRKKSPAATLGGFKVGDLVVYKRMECEVTGIDGKVVTVEDEDGDDYRVTDLSSLKLAATKDQKARVKEEEPEDEEDDAEEDEDQEVAEEDDEEDEEDEEEPPVKKGKKAGR